MSLFFISAAQAAETASPGGAFPPFDSSTFAGQLFWLALIFGTLYVLMSRIALPRVAGIIEDRRARIDADLANAAASQKAAEDASKAYEAGVAQARSTAQGIAQSAREAAAKEAEVRRHKVESDLSAKLVAAEASIAATKAKAMGNVEAIAKDTVGAIIERLTGTAPKDKSVADAIAALAKN